MKKYRKCKDCGLADEGYCAIFEEGYCRRIDDNRIKSCVGLIGKKKCACFDCKDFKQHPKTGDKK